MSKDSQKYLKVHYEFGVEENGVQVPKQTNITEYVSMPPEDAMQLQNVVVPHLLAAMQAATDLGMDVYFGGNAPAGSAKK